MPELPEVTTTVNGLNKVLPGQKISDVWSDYFVRTTSKDKNSIKNKKYFEFFKKETIGRKFLNAERRGKFILINISGGQTIIIHMKMTGHLLYGKYKKTQKTETKLQKIILWKPIEPETLKDPYNRFIHLIFSLSNGWHLAFSDSRKFGHVSVIKTSDLQKHKSLSALGPEANDLKLSWQKLKSRFLQRPTGKIKSVLLDQTVVAGIGNIYSDEILWASSIHPERLVNTLSDNEIRLLYKQAVRILSKSISLGGDSMSDYRNIMGEPGNYQKSHKAYRRRSLPCGKSGCPGKIVRKIIGGRSAHFCDIHQK